MSANKIPPNAFSDPKFYISILGLFLSIVAIVFSFSAQQSAKGARTDAVLGVFSASAENRPTAQSCFKYARQLNEDSLRQLFRDTLTEMNVEHSSQLPLIRNCLGDHSTTSEIRGQVLSISQVDKIRRTIFYKLNDFDRAFTAIEGGGVNVVPICLTVWTSFDQDAEELLSKIEQMSPRPEEFQAIDREYAANLRFIGGGQCRTN